MDLCTLHVLEWYGKGREGRARRFLLGKRGDGKDLRRMVGKLQSSTQ